jgi:hypothetical protein
MRCTHCIYTTVVTVFCVDRFPQLPPELGSPSTSEEEENDTFGPISTNVEFDEFLRSLFPEEDQEQGNHTGLGRGGGVVSKHRSVRQCSLDEFFRQREVTLDDVDPIVPQGTLLPGGVNATDVHSLEHAMCVDAPIHPYTSFAELYAEDQTKLLPGNMPDKEWKERTQLLAMIDKKKVQQFRKQLSSRYHAHLSKHRAKLHIQKLSSTVDKMCVVVERAQHLITQLVTFGNIDDGDSLKIDAVMFHDSVKHIIGRAKTVRHNVTNVRKSRRAIQPLPHTQKRPAGL